MSTVHVRAKSLLDAARADGPSAADRARIGAALAARLAPPAPPTPGASIAAKTLASGSAVPAVVVAITAGLLSSATPRLLVPSNAATDPIATTAPPAGSAFETTTAPDNEPPPTSEVPSRKLGEVRAPRIASSQTHRSREAAPPDGDSLAAELRLLRAAQLARADDPNRAIALLDELGARYPRGVLTEERMAARVLTLCAAGRVDEARAAGRSFLAVKPTSVQADRIRASCAFEKSSGATTDRRGADH